jgi:serine/threonine protein kinase
MAYELIAPCEEEEEETIPQVTVATDIWAFGMTALEVRSSSLSHFWARSNACLTDQIFTGELPFFHLKYDTAVILSVMSGGRPKHETYPAIGYGIWTMLEQCWNTEPAQRPSMEDLSVFFGVMLSKPLSGSTDCFMTADELGALPLVANNRPRRTILTSRDPNGGFESLSDRNLTHPAKSQRTCRWPSCNAGFGSFCEHPDHEVFHHEIRKPRR